MKIINRRLLILQIQFSRSALHKHSQLPLAQFLDKQTSALIDQVIIIPMQKQDIVEADIRNNKIKEGYLVKRSRILKEWKMRWMVLTKSHLYSFEQKGVYRRATEKIPLKEVTTIKSYYKNQYERPQVFRIESDDTSFYISAQNHQDKWSWMTAIEKTSELLANPAAQDSQNLIRETLRMSTAVRQSSLIPKKNDIHQQSTDLPSNIMKKLKLKLQSRVITLAYQPKPKQPKPFSIQKTQSFVWNEGENPKQATNKQETQKIIERIIEVEKIIEVRVPYEVQKIIERQRIVHVRSEQESPSGNLLDLFAALINCKLDDPKPLLDFVSFLGLSGIERYQAVALQFCCERDSHRFFAELLLQALNEQITEQRLNRYTAFIYLLCERDSEFFYASDLKILVEIVVRELEMYRSDLNQMVNLQLLKVLLTSHLKALQYKLHEIRAIAAEIANLGPHQNREIAQQICILIH